jgi:rubredoxin
VYGAAREGGIRRNSDGVMNKAMTEGLKTWICVICGHVYDEAEGDPQRGVPPGTRWSDVPADWSCPDCGASKDDFEMVEL